MQKLHDVCTVEGCGKPHKSRGYCQTHYMRYKRGVPVEHPVRPRGPKPPECVEEGCSSPVKGRGLCNLHYTRLLKNGHTRYRDRKRPAKSCSREGCENILYASGLCHVHYARERKIRQFGLTPEEHQSIFEMQNGLCAICGEGERANNAWSGKPKALAIDHCHETDQVRGLLCSSCNRAVGLFQDSPDLLAKAREYLLAGGVPWRKKPA